MAAACCRATAGSRKEFLSVLSGYLSDDPGALTVFAMAPIYARGKPEVAESGLTPGYAVASMRTVVQPTARRSCSVSIRRRSV